MQHLVWFILYVLNFILGECPEPLRMCAAWSRAVREGALLPSIHSRSRMLRNARSPGGKFINLKTFFPYSFSGKQGRKKPTVIFCDGDEQ